MSQEQVSWERLMQDAVRAMLDHLPYRAVIGAEHTAKTPMRVVAAFKEYFSGCEINTQEMLLRSLFPANSYSQMIHVKDILFHSVCAHHLALISGSAHFAYVPGDRIVGISKIPRLVEALSRRPQVQENMTEEIVDQFFKYVKPKGCGLFVTASHACMQCRGIRSQTAITDTTALRGSFLENPATRQEFLLAVKGVK